jgi:HEPN domain-containing protein
VPGDPGGWLEFADADLRAARLVLADDDVPSRIARFHAHQASEKVSKAALVAESIPFRETLDIVVLAGLVPAQLGSALSTLDFARGATLSGRWPLSPGIRLTRPIAKRVKS